MLVVDRVELGLLEQVEERRVFDCDDCLWARERGEPCNEIVQVRNVGHHVVCHDEPRMTHFGGDLRPDLCPRKIDLVSMPSARANFGDIVRRLDSEGPDPQLLEAAKEIAVVARDLDHDRGVVEPEFAGHPLGE